jgi:anti-anti-sigma regulatory factor
MSTPEVTRRMTIAQDVPVTSGRGLSVRVDDGAVVLAVAGNLDAATAAGFRTELLDLCDVCVGELTVDLSACTEITTAVVAVLETARQRCVRCRLSVVCGHPEITSVLARVGIPFAGS